VKQEKDEEKPSKKKVQTEKALVDAMSVSSESEGDNSFVQVV
jgi:hypothetical protein